MAELNHSSLNFNPHLDDSDRSNQCTGNFVELDLNIVSYNMHGYRQGKILLADLTQTTKVDAFLVQEHWLTPQNLAKFNYDFPNYYTFSSSALAESVEIGPLVGRPYGGLAILVKNELLSAFECVTACERFIVVRLGDVLIINVYLPCSGTSDRDLICRDVFDNISYWRTKFSDCACIIGGDFNVDLDTPSSSSKGVASIVERFFRDNNLNRCDRLCAASLKYTYANESLNQYSKLDYFASDFVHVKYFEVLDVEVNFSDHLPVLIRCNINLLDEKSSATSSDNSHSVRRLRWDHGDVTNYYNMTFLYLQPILDELLEVEKISPELRDVAIIDALYGRIVDILNLCAHSTIPCCKQDFFKFWWSQELDCLKQESIDSCRLWKAAGQPRSGPIFDRRNKARRAYRLAIRRNEMDPVRWYSNELHDALLQKSGSAFWKCWNSKFSIKSSKLNLIDGINDPQLIANKFAEHFAAACSSTSAYSVANLNLENTYKAQRSVYVGSPHTFEFDINSELMGDVISALKRGKAAGPDRLTAEHLSLCHPILSYILVKLFNWMLNVGHVPPQFGVSYTVPLPKCNTSCTKRLTVSDFRGISISPIISKVFEHCLLRKFGNFLTTSDSQFGFKKSLGCCHAIYTVRCVVDHYVTSGSTVNLCALDISKAFDRMSHHGLFIKLMDRLVPRTLLSVLEDWFNKCFTYVCWNSFYSSQFRLMSGVRQGGVLSPYLFAVFIDDIVDYVSNLNVGCKFRHISTSIVLYADDILLLAPSIHALQALLTACVNKLCYLALEVNVKKSACIRIGPRCEATCTQIVMPDGSQLPWLDSVRYLGIYIRRFRYFSCLFDNAKKSFYRSFNAVFGQIGRLASEEVILELLRSKCLPCLTYAVEACPVNSSEMKSFDFTLTRVFMKIFKTKSKEVVTDCQMYFGFPTIADVIKKRKVSFLSRYSLSSNSVCHLFNAVAVRDRPN